MPPIAARVLTLTASGTRVHIGVSIFAPVKTAEGSWGCRYIVSWPDQPSDRTVYGFDSIQAVVHALQSIGAEIYTSNYHKAGQLSWDPPHKGYGFPVVPTFRNLLVGEDARHL
ncbi:MAG: hypothetical protein OJF62_003119 [Pseudolabrys sp.]|jgi:hypothetical protein|nr:hypothetical protein [Pseudolabrys sp.]